MNVTFQLCWSCIVSSAVHWCFHRNFGPESLGPPDRNFQWKNSPLRFILSVKVVTPLEIWSGSCKLERQSVVHWMHVRKSFPCLLLPHFHTSLFPSGAFLWLFGSFSPGTVLGASMSAPIKAHHLFVSRKTSYLRWLFFLSSNIPRFPDATDYLQHWTIFFHKRQLRSNIVLVLGPLIQVRTKFYRGKWFWRTIFPGILVSRTTFFARPKFLWQYNLALNMELVKSAHMVKFLRNFQ